MAMRVTKVDVWAGDLTDQPGGLDRVLSALADAGADLQCVIARRHEGQPGRGELFVSAIRGKRAQTAAQSAGLRPAADVPTLRVEGADAPGMGHRITQAIAEAGVNLRGCSAMTDGKAFVAYFGFDDVDGMSRAMTAIKSVDKGGRAKAGRTARRRASARRSR
jgi:hypothetical protein